MTTHPSTKDPIHTVIPEDVLAHVRRWFRTPVTRWFIDHVAARPGNWASDLDHSWHLRHDIAVERGRGLQYFLEGIWSALRVDGHNWKHYPSEYLRKPAFALGVLYAERRGLGRTLCDADDNTVDE